MTTLSRLEIERTFKDCSCKQLFHPWSDSCLHGGLEMGISCCLGCAKIFSIQYAIQLGAKIYKRKKIKFDTELKHFFWSLIFGILYGTQFVSWNCLLRKILGKHSFYVEAYLVPMASGLPIFIETPQRRSFLAASLVTMAFEGVYNKLKSIGIVRPVSLGGSLVFMLLNGLLMCQLRKQTDPSISRNCSWFFLPSSIKRTNPEEECIYDELKSYHCTHDLTCINSLKKELVKYGSVSMLISLAKLIAENFKTPSRILRNAIQWRNFQLSAFVISYIGLFKVISCWLCKAKGDSLQNTFLAGSVAGLSYTFIHNQTFIFSVLSALIEATGKQMKKKYRLPNLPYTEISFILGNAYILYLRLFDRPICPKSVYSLFNICTSDKAEIINKMVYNRLIEAMNYKKIHSFCL